MIASRLSSCSRTVTQHVAQCTRIVAIMRVRITTPVVSIPAGRDHALEDPAPRRELAVSSRGQSSRGRPTCDGCLECDNLGTARQIGS